MYGQNEDERIEDDVRDAGCFECYVFDQECKMCCLYKQRTRLGETESRVGAVSICERKIAINIIEGDEVRSAPSSAIDTVNRQCTAVSNISDDSDWK